jgi:hypothetical protein
MPRPKSNKESARFRQMVHEHLRQARASFAARSYVGTHLDEDALSAFVEGRLNELESTPVVRHLVSCASCRHITAQLIRLDTDLSASEAPIHTPASSEEPGRIRRLLESLASRVLPSTGDDEVMAYHAPADDFEQKEEDKKEKETGNEESE